MALGYYPSPHAQNQLFYTSRTFRASFSQNHEKNDGT